MKAFVLFLSIIAAAQATLASDLYHVGYRNLDFKMSDTVSAHARVWYPIDKSMNEKTIQTAPFLKSFSGNINSNVTSLPNKLPLLLISHGSGAMVERLDWVADAFARKGWIVAGFNHPGNSFDNNSALGLIKVWNRAKDTSNFLTYLLNEDQLKDKIDQSKIYALGHSAGGAEILLLAGARFAKRNFTNPLPLCEPAKNPDLDDEKCSDLRQIDFSTFPTDEVEGNYTDSRIKAFIGLDPGFAHSFNETIQPNKHTMLFIADKLKQPSGQLYSKDLEKIFPDTVFSSIAGSIHISFISSCNEMGFKKKIPLCIGDKNREKMQKTVIKQIEKFLNQSVN